MQPLDFEHFSSNDHNGFLEDCSITLIDKTDGSDPTRREEYWRRVMKTVTPIFTGKHLCRSFFLIKGLQLY